MILSGLLILMSTYSTNYTIYSDSSLNTNFTLDYDINSCLVPQLQRIYNDNPNSNGLAIQEITISGNEQFTMSYTVSNIVDNDYEINQGICTCEIANSFTQPSFSQMIYITHSCSEDLDNSNYWGLMKVQLILNNQPLVFYYESICSETFDPNKFDFSYMIVVFTGVLFVFLTSRFGEIASLHWANKKFQGILINYWYFLLFVSTLLVLFGFSYLPGDAEVYLLSALSYACNIFYLIEVCCYIRIHYFNQYQVVPFYLLGWFLGSIPVITFFVFGFDWIINDIIFILNLGTYFKLFKVNSFKDCITVYLPFILFNSVLNYVVYLKIELGTQISTILNLTQFFSLQAPMFNYIPNRKCAFIEINTLFLPGLMIAYTVRYAKASKSYVYFIIYFLGMFLGLTCWLATTFLNSEYQITSLLFTIIPSSVLSAILCFYRNELATFYGGHFYDAVLDDPFRAAKEMQAPEQTATELVTSVNLELPTFNPSLFQGLT